MTTLVLNFSLMLVAMDMGLNVTSSILAVQLGVPFSCILAAIVFKDYLGPWRSAGLMVAFMGVVVIAGTPNAFEHSTAFMIAIFSGLAWSAGNLYLKVMPPSRIVPLLFWPGLMTMAIMGVLSLAFEENHVQLMQDASWHSWAGLAYGALISSIVGYGLWNRLMTTYPVSYVVPFTLLLPIAGISGGVLFFGEPLTARILFGAALTIAGVGIIALRRPRLVEAEKA
jgi:O-acetylserine/cysteine efflux transporter